MALVVGICGVTIAPRASNAQQDSSRPRERTIVETMQADARRLGEFVQSDIAIQFLAATAQLPPAPARTVHRRPGTRNYISAIAFEDASEDRQAEYEPVELDARRYYYTLYGTPLAYCRVVDLLGRHGVTTLEEKRVLDFGYGTIGHLRLLGSLGADAVGVDVDSFLTALYSEPGDVGAIANPSGNDGSITLVEGQWPADEEIIEAVGGGFDIITSKNTLKRGYIHPERETDPTRLVHLGVDDATFVDRVFESLNPGGLVLIYNLSPRPAPLDQPYIPWADGRCPFDRELIEAVGFEVVAYDVDDGASARRMGHLLGWDQGDAAMDLEDNLFAKYTLLRRPATRD